MDISASNPINYARVDYHNFQGDVSPLAQGYNLSKGINVQINKTGYVQSITLLSPFDFDWRYLTSNLRLEDMEGEATDWGQ